MYRAGNDLAASLGFRGFLGGIGVLAVSLLCGTFLLCGCGKSAGNGSSGATAVQLTLDWKPEPEFGGFYAAKQDGAFSRHGLDATIAAAGEGADTWQLVATGKTEFATSSADQVLIAPNKTRT